MPDKKNDEKITIFDAGPLSRWADLTDEERDDFLQSMVDRFKSTVLNNGKPDTETE